MKHSTQYIGMSLPRRLWATLINDRSFVRALLSALCGLVYARAGILDITGVFGAALVAGVAAEDALSSCLGAVLGYLLVPEPSGNIGFIILCVAVLGVKLTVGHRLWKDKVYSGSMIASFSVVLVGFPVLILTSGAVSDYLILAAQTLLAAATAYFVSNLYVAGSPVLTRRGRMGDISVVVCLCIFAGGLVGLRLGGVSLGCAAVVLLSLCSGYALGAAGGSAMGTVGGLAVAFVTGDFGLNVAMYALGGLMAGTFRPLGRMGSAVAFVLSGGFVMLSVGRQMPLSSFVEVMLGSVAFIALPEEVLVRISKAFSTQLLEEAAVRRAVANRLRAGVEGLREVGLTTQRVAHRLEEQADRGLESLPDAVANTICRSCPKNMTCWVQNYGETQSAINELAEQLRRQNTSSEELLPDWFRRRCTQPDRLAKLVERQYRACAERLRQQRKVVRVRSIVTDQFDGMAMFLEGIEKEIKNCCPAGPVVTARVRSAFSRWGVEPLSLSCILSCSHHLEVEAVLPSEGGEGTDPKRLARLVGEAVGRSFALPLWDKQPNRVVVQLRERGKYRLRTEASQSAQKEGGICGDSWRSFGTEDGKLHIILSDGMGCGGNAALDSAMAVSLMKRMVKAGADYNSALRMVNSALLVKSGEETLATMDAAVVDLYNGKVSLYKAGAAPTILRRGKRAGSVESVSSPAGILSGVSFEQSTLWLKEGDWLIMMSDGATAAGVDWIAEELEHYDRDDPAELARKLACAARLRRSDGRSDDITVICAVLEAESY